MKKFLPMALFAAVIAAVDQWTKFLVVSYIPENPILPVPFLPDILSLTHTKNDGAGWSSLSGMRWLFVLVFLLITVLLIWEYFKKPMAFTTLERWCIAAVYGGGLGNTIDRVRTGLVVDMIKTDFMNFPVFNVADCFITCGCILLMVHLIFFNKKFWKDGKK